MPGAPVRKFSGAKFMQTTMSIKMWKLDNVHVWSQNDDVRRFPREIFYHGSPMSSPMSLSGLFYSCRYRISLFDFEFWTSIFDVWNLAKSFSLCENFLILIFDKIFQFLKLYLLRLAF